jgi:phospholipid/cholesterol/gamma-HCH transport system substrate-binding protein
MEDSNYKLGVGLVVVAAAIIGMALILFFGAIPSIFDNRYRVTIKFPSAPNVGKDSSVIKNGVEIGRVAGVKLLEGNEGVNLVLELNSNVQLARGETCRITSGSLITGEGVVEFERPTQSILIQRFDGVGGGQKNGVLDPEETALAQMPLADGDYLEGGVVTGNPLDVLMNRQEDFAKTLAAIEQAGRRIDSVGATIEGVLGGGDGQFEEMTMRIRTTVDNFNQTVQTIDRVARQFEEANIPESLGNTISRLPVLFDEAQRIFTQTQNALRGFEEFSVSLKDIGKEFDGIGDQAKETLENANVALENIADLTRPLSQQADQIVTTTMRALDNLDGTLGEIRTFTRRLNEGQGTIARLIEDDQLYYSLITTVDNVKRVTNEMQPIIDDVRIITDKVARDPSQLGVRGVLKSNPLGAGFK